MGTLIGSAVCPIGKTGRCRVVNADLQSIVALAIMSKKANRKACVVAAWLGLAAGLAAWLATAAALNGGKIDLNTTGQDYPMLAGKHTRFVLRI